MQREYTDSIMSKFKVYVSESSKYIIKSPDHPEFESAILLEVVLDFTSFDDITHLKRHTGYIFDVDGETTILKGYSAGGSDWRIKFGSYDGRGGIKNVNMKNENDVKRTIETIRQISRCLYLFMNYYKPENIRFGADRRSRQKMYERVVNRLIQQPEFMSYDLRTIPSDTSGVMEYHIYKKRGGNGKYEWE